MIGKSESIEEPIDVEPLHWGLRERSDTELIATAWVAGFTTEQVMRHFLHDVSTEDESGLGRASWRCRTCSAGGESEPDARIAAARGRGHWRHELGVAIDLASQ